MQLRTFAVRLLDVSAAENTQGRYTVMPCVDQQVTYCLHHGLDLSLDVIKLIHELVLTVLDLLLRHVPAADALRSGGI